VRGLLYLFLMQARRTNRQNGWNGGAQLHKKES
jgi:hypothetical protein